MIGLLFLLRQDLAMKPGLNYLYMPTFWVLGIHACTTILSNNDNTMRLRNNHYLSLSPSLFLSVSSLFSPVKKKKSMEEAICKSCPELSLLAPWSWMSSFQNYEKWVSVVWTPNPGYFVKAATLTQILF